MKKKILIVGAGPGGLTAGMILAHRGYEVEIYEKEDRVGGRNASFDLQGFKFDIGPTFLMLKPTLDEVFREAGENSEDLLQFSDLDPMYHLVFKDHSLRISPDHARTREEIRRNFPGEEEGFDRLLIREKDRFAATYPCLKRDYSAWHKMFNRDLLHFLPKMSFPNSMYEELGTYFKSDDLKMAFTFQSKYLGMSPWECPAAYMIIPYIEHNFGIQHVRGGLSEISAAMAKVVAKNGGHIYLDSSVTEVKKKELVLAGGRVVKGDAVIVNADAGYAYKELIGRGDLSQKDFSCSTFMLYLGVDQPLDWDHHTIFFSDDYKDFVDSVFIRKETTDDISIYARNASPLDPTLAPAGKSSLYILVPAPNNKSGIDWSVAAPRYRQRVLERLKEKAGIDLEKHILVEKMITPTDWEKDFNVFLGATFNLAHRLSQMLYFRPHNQLEKDLFLAGGGTHPGSGLPTIYESGRIAADLISK